MTKIQHKRSSVLVSGAAQAPTSAQLDYGELAINYSSTDPQFFIKDSSGSVISILSSYAPLDGATFTGDVNFDAEAIIKGDLTNSGALTLNSETNSKYVKIQAPANSSLTSYTLTLPNDDGGSGEVLSTDGSGGLSWAYAAMSTADKTKLDGIAAGAEVNVNADWTASSGDAQILNKPTNVSAFSNDSGYLTSFDITTQTDSKYLRSDTDDTASGVITLTSSSQYPFVINGSNDGKIVLQGSASPYIRFRESSTDKAFIQWNSSGYLELTNTEDGSAIRIRDDIEFTNNNGTNWYNIWHANNDGSGSGLDADLVDGIQAASFLRSDTDDTCAHRILFQKCASSNHDTIATSSGSLGAFEVYNSGSANDAFFAMHTGGDFACYFGLDAGINDIAVGGWSMGANSYRVWHAGNDGSGSGLDADNLDGYTWTSSGKNIRGTEIYADNWFRNYNSGEGIYNEANNVHFYSDATNTWRVRTNQTSVRLRMATASNSTRGYFYADNSNQIGILDSDANWAIKHVRDSRTEFYVNNTEYGELNSDYFYHSSDIRSKIFYDSDNTSYYIHPGSTSQLFGLNIRNFLDLADNDILRLGSGDDAELFCNGSHLYLDLNSGIGNFYIRDGTTTRYTFDDNGSFTATGNITAYSDLRLKSDICEIKDALTKVNQIRGVTYMPVEENQTEEPLRRAGVIAQEVESVLPEVVTSHEDGMKSVAYGNLTALLIEAIKELSVRLTSLENKL